MAREKVSQMFFVTFLSVGSLFILLVLFSMDTFNLRSLAKEKGARMLRLRAGEEAVVYCRGGFIGWAGDTDGNGSYLCEGSSIDEGAPDVKPEKGKRYILLNIGQKFNIDCPTILHWYKYLDNKERIYCVDYDEYTPTPTFTPTPTYYY
jgi:hypothetical protein